MMAIWYCLIVVWFVCVGMEYWGGREIMFGKGSVEKVGEIWERGQVIRSSGNESESEGELQVQFSTLLR